MLSKLLKTKKYNVSIDKKRLKTFRLKQNSSSQKCFSEAETYFYKVKTHFLKIKNLKISNY